jgi:hypothetical protein
MAGAGSTACASSYDLVARSAVAMDAGKLAGHAKFVRPGDAVQDVSKYQNAETTGSTRVKPARAAQSAAWGQPAAGVQVSAGGLQAPGSSLQTPTSGLQKATGSRALPGTQPAVTHAEQKPSWTPAPSPLGQQ